jgi:ketosteroid isomerase-like protein
MSRLFALSIVAAVSILCAAAPALAASPVDEAQQVRALFTGFIDAQNQHNLDAIQSKLWDSPQVYWLSFDGPLYGQKAILARFKRLFSGVWSATPDYTKTAVVIHDAQNADVVTPVSITTTAPGAAVAGKSLIVVACTKTDSGWKIAGIIPIAAAVQNY